MFKTQKWKSLRSRVCVWQLEAIEYVGNVLNVQLTFRNFPDFVSGKCRQFLKFFQICVALHVTWTSLSWSVLSFSIALDRRAREKSHSLNKNNYFVILQEGHLHWPPYLQWKQVLFVPHPPSLPRFLQMIKMTMRSIFTCWTRSYLMVMNSMVVMFPLLSHPWLKDVFSAWHR